MTTTQDFKTETPELVTGPNGKKWWAQVCYDLDPESGRWEPFLSTWPGTWGIG